MESFHEPDRVCCEHASSLGRRAGQPQARVSKYGTRVQIVNTELGVTPESQEFCAKS